MAIATSQEATSAAPSRRVNVQEALIPPPRALGGLAKGEPGEWGVEAVPVGQRVLKTPSPSGSASLAAQAIQHRAGLGILALVRLHPRHLLPADPPLAAACRAAVTVSSTATSSLPAARTSSAMSASSCARRAA